MSESTWRSSSYQYLLMRLGRLLIKKRDLRERQKEGVEVNLFYNENLPGYIKIELVETIGCCFYSITHSINKVTIKRRFSGAGPTL